MTGVQEVLRWVGQGLASSASLAHALPATLRFPVDSATSHGPQSTLDANSINSPLFVVGNQGPYSPFLSQESYLPRGTPEGWTIDQVSVIMRHGARNPTASAGKKISASLALLNNRTSIADSAFDFVDGYSFDSYTADALTDFGRKECYDAGVAFRKAYADLDDGLFVRAASDGRVVESSGWFLQGWNGEAFDLGATLEDPAVIISEDDGMNNTLSISTCSADESLDPNYGDIAHENWQSVYAPPIIARLEAALPGISLTAQDVNYIMSVCGFESVSGLQWEESPWCSEAIFTREEWQQHEYYYDLDKYYAHGAGSPYGKVSGIGYVNELIARLTATDVHLGAGTNATLDTDSATFPLDKTFYVDFSHDNNMVPILVTLGLLLEDDLRSEPDATAIPAHNFVVSKTVPFAGRFVFERLRAPDGAHYVRVLVNDAVVALDVAGCGLLGARYGLCELGAFVAFRAAYSQADPSPWDEVCYAPAINRTVPL